MRKLLAKAWTTLRSEGAAAFARKTWRKLQFWAEAARLPYVESLAWPDGEQLRLCVNTPFARHWYTQALAHSIELDWIRRSLRPGDRVADCGANNGFTSMLFARAVGPQGFVVGFEPSPVNLEAARENLRLNGVRNVELVAAAVGAASARVHFDPGFGNGSVATGGPIEVAQVALDGYLDGARIDFVKIDVEGYELEVLRGARSALAQRPGLAIEIHVATYADRERTVAELLGLLDLQAYDAQVQLEVDGPLVRFDPAVHTPAALARHSNVHWLGLPRVRTPAAGRPT